MKKIALILVGACIATGSRAATVNWGASIDTGLITSTGLALATGNWLEIGYFGTLTPSQVQTAVGTGAAGVQTVLGDFHLFASGQVGANTSAAGSFALSNNIPYANVPALNGSGAATTPFAGASQQMYFLALNSTNTTSLANATALANLTQLAIAYVPFSSLSGWQFPSADNSPIGGNIDVSDLSNANRQILDGIYVSANSPSLTSFFGTTNHALQLAPVPEPSVFTFGALAFLAAAGSRKRGRK